MVSLTDISNHQQSVRLFSSRERDILKLLAKGYSTQMIEETFHISQHTVCTHCRNMHKKCSVQNTAQLISLATREGYILHPLRSSRNYFPKLTSIRNSSFSTE